MELRDILHVYAEIVTLEELPDSLDSLVDGFPTVLVLREVDTGKGIWSGAAERFGRREVPEIMDVP